MSLGERIEKLNNICKAEGTTLTKRLGIKSSTYSTWKNRTKNLTQDAIDKILNTFPHINPRWLTHGEEPMLKLADARLQTAEEQPSPSYDKIIDDRGLREHLADIDRRLKNLEDNIFKKEK
jgi:hypothetical protein